MAAKIFVFVISQKFSFRVSRIFSRISRNFPKHEIKIWAKFSQFRETRNQNLAKIFAILQTINDFLLQYCRSKKL